MADTLPSPPESRSISPSSNQHEKNEELSKQLDELLERYLEFLDTYTKLREDLSKAFSAGFFSLAQAQKASTLGAGRRYGQECYDQRMKAQRIVKVEEKESGSTIFRMQKSLLLQKADNERNMKSSAQESKETAQPAVEKTESIESSPPLKTPRVKQDPALRDPLTWFGILAPPSLRQTQSNFSQATQEIIPLLLTVDSDMKRLEDRIWAVRAELGLMSQYKIADADAAASLSDSDDMDEEIAKLSLVKENQTSGSKMQKLTSRSAHSKSTLLKLGE